MEVAVEANKIGPIPELPHIPGLPQLRLPPTSMMFSFISRSFFFKNR
jgi:hypothetical protein